MNTLDNYIAEYLEYCEYRKRLDAKSIKAYRIDLKQFYNFCNGSDDFLSRNTVDLFITFLHRQYKPKTVKRKIAIFAKPSFFRKQFPFIPSKSFCL